MYKFSKVFLIAAVLGLASCSTKRIAKSSIPDNQIVIHKQDVTKKYSEPKTFVKERAIQTDHKYCYLSCPSVDPKVNHLINHGDFILSYNLNTKYADWVGYKIDKSKLSGSTKKRVWKADPKIPEHLALKPSDYKGASLTCNYDRGHQAPLADFSNSVNWEKANYLSNITPQKANLNQGAWNNLESKIRKVAKEHKGDLYILTGTYYNGKPTCQLPHARIANTIPNGYWKVITLISDNNVYKASFKFEQDTPKNNNFCRHHIKFEDLKKLVGYPLNLTESNEDSKVLLNLLGCDS